MALNEATLSSLGNFLKGITSRGYAKKYRKTIEWERLEMSSRKLEIPREHFREGSGTPLQYFCLENPMDGGAW